MHKPRIAFFGTPEIAVLVLERLSESDIVPDLVVTAPDRPRGRGLKLSPAPVKVRADERGIATLQPEKIDEAFLETLQKHRWDLFLVAAYGKILPKTLLDIPGRGTLNVHPSLLPKLRGATPIESAILEGAKETGVSIMLLDEKMDHGPVVLQEALPLRGDERADELERALGLLGGELLAKTVPAWLSETIEAREQDHSQATFTKKITKEDGLIDPAGDALTNWRKFRAFHGWPGTYFFAERGGKRARVIVKKASFEGGVFKIENVLPEGGREMAYNDFLRGL